MDPVSTNCVILSHNGVRVNDLPSLSAIPLRRMVETARAELSAFELRATLYWPWRLLGVEGRLSASLRLRFLWPGFRNFLINTVRRGSL